MMMMMMMMMVVMMMMMVMIVVVVVVLFDLTEINDDTWNNKQWFPLRLLERQWFKPDTNP